MAIETAIAKGHWDGIGSDRDFLEECHESYCNPRESQAKSTTVLRSAPRLLDWLGQLARERGHPDDRVTAFTGMGAAFHPCFTANAISPTGSNVNSPRPDPQNLDFNDSKVRPDGKTNR